MLICRIIELYKTQQTVMRMKGYSMLYGNTDIHDESIDVSSNHHKVYDISPEFSHFETIILHCVYQELL